MLDLDTLRDDLTIVLRELGWLSITHKEQIYRLEAVWEYTLSVEGDDLLECLARLCDDFPASVMDTGVLPEYDVVALCNALDALLNVFPCIELRQGTTAFPFAWCTCFDTQNYDALERQTSHFASAAIECADYLETTA